MSKLKYIKKKYDTPPVRGIRGFFEEDTQVAEIEPPAFTEQLEPTQTFEQSKGRYSNIFPTTTIPKSKYPEVFPITPQIPREDNLALQNNNVPVDQIVSQIADSLIKNKIGIAPGMSRPVVEDAVRNNLTPTFDAPISQERMERDLDTPDSHIVAEGKDFLGSFAGGALGIPEGLAGAADYLGLPGADKAANKIQEWRQAIQPKNPNFMTNLLSGAGSMAVFLPFGIGATTLSRMMATVSPKLANAFGLGAMTVLESATEAGNIYNQSKDSAAAEKAFLANMMLVGITNRYDLTGQSTKLLKNALLSMPLEALQEGGQSLIETASQGKEPNYDDIIESAGIGALIGGGATVSLANPNKTDGVNQYDIEDAFGDQINKSTYGREETDAAVSQLMNPDIEGQRYKLPLDSQQTEEILAKENQTKPQKGVTQERDIIGDILKGSETQRQKQNFKEIKKDQSKVGEQRPTDIDRNELLEYFKQTNSEEDATKLAVNLTQDEAQYFLTGGRFGVPVSQERVDNILKGSPTPTQTPVSKALDEVESDVQPIDENRRIKNRLRKLKKRHRQGKPIDATELDTFEPTDNNLKNEIEKFKNEVKPREQKVAEIKARRDAKKEVGSEKGIKQTFNSRKKNTFANGDVFAIKTKDGKILSHPKAASHLEVQEYFNVHADNIIEAGFANNKGVFKKGLSDLQDQIDERESEQPRVETEKKPDEKAVNANVESELSAKTVNELERAEAILEKYKGKDGVIDWWWDTRLQSFRDIEKGDLIAVVKLAAVDDYGVGYKKIRDKYQPRGGEIAKGWRYFVNYREQIVADYRKGFPSAVEIEVASARKRVETLPKDGGQAVKKPSGKAVSEKPIEPIRQLGTGSNVYFETDKFRVNDNARGKNVLLNIGGNESQEVPIANIEFDTADEAVKIAKELNRIYPEGVPSAVLIDKVIENIKKGEYSNPKQPTKDKESKAEMSEKPKGRVNSDVLEGKLKSKPNDSTPDLTAYKSKTETRRWNEDQIEALVSFSEPVKDLSQNDTGWRSMDILDRSGQKEGVALINPKTLETIEFRPKDAKSGSELSATGIEANAYAIDNPIEAKPIPKGEIITKDLAETKQDETKKIIEEYSKPRNKKNKSRFREPETWQESLALFVVQGGKFNAKEFSADELRDNFGLTNRNINKANGAAFDTFISDVGMVNDEQYNDSDFDQSRLVREFLSEYNTHQKRIEYLESLNKDIDKQFTEQLSDNEIDEMDEYFALDEIIFNEYLTPDGEIRTEDITFDEEDILRRANTTKEKLDSYLEEKQAQFDAMEDFEFGDDPFADIENVVNEGAEDEAIIEAEVEQAIEDAGREETRTEDSGQAESKAEDDKKPKEEKLIESDKVRPKTDDLYNKNYKDKNEAKQEREAELNRLLKAKKDYELQIPQIKNEEEKYTAQKELKSIKNRIEKLESELKENNLFETNQDEDQDVLFQKANTENDLIVLHNLSERNLRNVDKIGGLAMPSLAIAHKERGFSNFGEISLIADKSLIDPRLSKKNQVAPNDMYSARYPSLSYQMDRKQYDALNDKVRKELDLELDFSTSDFEASGYRAIESNDRIRLLFLKEKGLLKEIVYRKNDDFTPEQLKPFEKIGDYEDVYYYINKGGKYYNEFEAAVKKQIEREIKTEPELNYLFFDDNGNVKYNFLKDRFYSIADAVKLAKKPEIDIYRTLEKNDFDKHFKEFEEFASDIYDDLNPTERIFQGYTPSGNRRYSAHNLDNVVKEMRKSGGESFFYGVGSLRSKVTPRFKSLSEIIKKKDKIIRPAEMQKLKDEVNQELIDLTDELKGYYKYSGGFGYIEEAAQELPRIARGSSKDFEGVPSDLVKKAQEFINKIKNLPTEYFEAKINRGVGVDEFVGAIVPENASQKTLDILKKNGITRIKRYKTEAERKEALQSFDDVLFQKQSNEKWYSQLEQVTEQKAPGTITPNNLQQYLTMLKKNGVRDEEIEWLDLESFVTEKRTKAEVLEYIKENNVQIEEVEKGGELPSGWSVAENEYEHGLWEVTDSDGMGVSEGDSREAAIDNAQEKIRQYGYQGTVTKFSQWQEPGGENYKELLLTLPEKKISDTYSVRKGAKDEMGRDLFGVHNDRTGELIFPYHHTENSAIKKAKELTEQREKYPMREGNFTSSHFDEPNILAHIRFNDRTDSNGNRILFLEEVQSDWHQAGRKKGYKGEEEVRQQFGISIGGTEPNIFFDTKELAQERINNIKSNFPDDELTIVPVERKIKTPRDFDRVPNAPFKNTWHELALKRMLRYAAENGYDGISWTTGEMQAERYDLSKQVNYVIGNGQTKVVSINLKDKDKYQPDLNLYYDNNGKVIDGVKDFVGENLSDVVGKELADKILKLDGYKKFEGLDLKVGGKGMKGFYDKMIPSYLKKYGKKWGARVGRTEIANAGDYNLKDVDPNKPIVLDDTRNNVTTPFFPITDKMKESVMGGQPLFQKNGKGKKFKDMSEGERKLFFEEIQKGINEEWTARGKKNLNFRGEPLNGLADLINKVIEVDIDSADFTTAFEESFHASMVALAKPGQAETLLKANGWDGKGKITDVGKNKSLRDAHEKLAQKYIDFRLGKSRESGGLFTRLKEFWEALSNVLAKRGYASEAKYFRELADGTLKAKKRKSESKGEGVLKQTKTKLSEEIYAANRNTKTNPVKESTQKEIQSAIDFAREKLVPISTRLGEIAPSLKNRLREFEFDLGLEITVQTKRIEPFLKKTSKLDKGTQADLDLALKNGDMDKIREIVEENDLADEYQELRSLLDELYQKALDVGLDLGYRKDYHPRTVKDLEGFIEYFEKSGEWNRFQELLDEKQAMKGDVLTLEEKVNIINNALRGYNSGISLSKTANMKERTVPVIDAELNKFYYDSNSALVRYINGVNELIEARMFFGKKKEKVVSVELTDIREKTKQVRLLKRKALGSPTEQNIKAYSKANYELAIMRRRSKDYQERLQQRREKTLYEQRILKGNASMFKGKAIPVEEYSIDNSIANYVLDLVKENQLNVKDANEIERLFKARFNQKGTSGIISSLKNASYVIALGSPTSAITQIGDLAIPLYRTGTLRTLEALGKSVFKRSTINLEDLGINPEKIAQEFSDTRKRSRVVQTVFKLTGFNYIDVLGKETLINATLKKYQKQAQKPNKEFMRRLENVFEGETDQVIEDLKNKEITENVKLLLFNELLDTQPMALSEMPEGYLTAENGRIFYMLKTFFIRRIDYYRNETFKLMRSKETRGEGIKNLINLTIAIMLMEAGADELKDLLLGRKTSLSDRVIDNLARIVGFSKYSVDQVARNGLFSTVAEMIIPPFDLFDDAQKDIANYINGEDKPIRTVKNVPVLGKVAYHWWFGDFYKSENPIPEDIKEQMDKRSELKEKALETGSKKDIDAYSKAQSELEDMRKKSKEYQQYLEYNREKQRKIDEQLGKKKNSLYKYKK